MLVTNRFMRLRMFESNISHSNSAGTQRYCCADDPALAGRPRRVGPEAYVERKTTIDKAFSKVAEQAYGFFSSDFRRQVDELAKQQKPKQ
jgi:hypothetical protein